MRKELLSVVIVSEGAVLPVVAAAEELEEEVASPTVDPATLGTVIVPETSVWFCVSVESAEVLVGGFLLTGTGFSLEVGVWATVVSPSGIPLVGRVPSRAVAGAEVLAVDRVPDGLTVSGRRGFVSMD